MRYTGPRNRIARREGVDLGLKTPGSQSHARLLKKINIAPGQHGTNTRRKISERARQLRETRKLRYIYGITLKTLKRYFQQAVKKTGNTGLYLSQQLEQRLDNIIYRIGIAPTRACARQLVSHGHVLVNDKRVNIASYQVGLNDIVTVKEASLKLPVIEKSLANKDIIIPPWVEKKAHIGKLTGKPTTEMIDKQIEIRLVIEYFSR